MMIQKIGYIDAIHLLAAGQRHDEIHIQYFEYWK